MSVFTGDRIVQPDLVHGLTRHRLPGELHGGQHPIAPPPKLRREVLFSLNSAHQLDSIRADCCFLQRLVMASGEQRVGLRRGLNCWWVWLRIVNHRGVGLIAGPCLGHSGPACADGIHRPTRPFLYCLLPTLGPRPHVSSMCLKVFR